VGDIDFYVISAAENSNKFQKTTFWKENWKEKAVADVVTLGPTAQATLADVKRKINIAFSIMSMTFNLRFT
jgi:hypothetical protein